MLNLSPIFSLWLNSLSAPLYPKFEHTVCLVWFIDPVALQMNSWSVQILSTATIKICTVPTEFEMPLVEVSVFVCAGDPACF